MHDRDHASQEHEEVEDWETSGSWRKFPYEPNLLAESNPASPLSTPGLFQPAASCFVSIVILPPELKESLVALLVQVEFLGEIIGVTGLMEAGRNNFQEWFRFKAAAQATIW